MLLPDSKLHVRVIAADQSRAVADALGFISFPSIELGKEMHFSLLPGRLVSVIFDESVFDPRSSLLAAVSMVLQDGSTKRENEIRDERPRAPNTRLLLSHPFCVAIMTHAKWHLERGSS